MTMKKRSRFGTVALLAALLHLAAQLAPLWMPDAKGMQIQICSTQGVRTIILDENGRQMPEQPTPLRKNCPFCIVAAGSVTMPGLALHETPRFVYRKVFALPFTHLVTVRLQPRTLYPQGPPVFS